jgi:hypothetical protein
MVGQAAGAGVQRGFKGGFPACVYLLYNVYNTGILITILPSCFQSHAYGCF